MACPGYCCRCFVIDCRPRDIAKAICEDNEYAKKLSDMLIPLGRDPSQFNERNLPVLRNGRQRSKFNSWDSHYYYSCVHYNWETHLCNDYENRPEMCKRYPNGRECEFEGCDHKE
jgi:Fe-S-cluster containining protein